VASFLGETNFIPGVIERETSRDHLWSVKTPVGQFWGRHTETSWTPSTGESVTLSIRPESWSIVPFKEIRNSVQGTIERAIYLGDMAQYEIDVPQHGRLRLGQTNPRLLLPMDGSVYAVAVDPDDVVILRK
jgi:ABC-type Fe3+/spermidine/putrescine transport system ATPase subunit